MSYTTLFQANYYFDVRNKNKVMRQHKIPVKYYAEYVNGTWTLKKECEHGNLPDKLQAYKAAKDALAEYYKDKLKPHWD